ncbi:MAG: mechanosensitive ion channel domain-containing protein [Nannocystaceae bacterium]
MLSHVPSTGERFSSWLEELAAGADSLLALAIAGLVLFALFALLSRSLRTTRLRRVASTVGVGFALIFTIFTIYVMATTRSTYLSLLILMVFSAVFALSWQAVRDVAAGIICRAGGLVRLGDHLAVESTAGVVSGVGLRSFTIRSASAEEVVVPYGRLMRASVHRSRSEEGGRAVLLQVEIPSGLTPRNAMALVQQTVFLNHWASIRHRPGITLSGPQRLSVTVQLIDPAREIEVEQALVRALAAATREA